MNIKLFTKNLKHCYIVNMENNMVTKSLVHKKTKEMGFKFQGIAVIDVKDIKM